MFDKVYIKKQKSLEFINSHFGIKLLDTGYDMSINWGIFISLRNWNEVVHLMTDWIAHVDFFQLICEAEEYAQINFD
jgi:hypothetical protein